MGEQVALAHEQQVAAVIGLVHDVAGDQQRGAAPGEVVELLPQVDPQYGVEADGGFVEHQQVWVRHQRTGQRHPGALAAGEVAAQRSSVIVEADRPQSRRRRRSTSVPYSDAK